MSLPLFVYTFMEMSLLLLAILYATPQLKFYDFFNIDFSLSFSFAVIKEELFLFRE